MNDNPQIAFLVIAHNQPRHLNRLITTLNHDNFRFFIHVDKKSDISEFKKYQYPTNAHFIEERITITHSGFSVAQSMIILLREAFKDQDVNYFYFLSGWDYPIKKNEFIYNFLKKHYPMNYINFYPLIGKADYIKNIQRYFFHDKIGSAPSLLKNPLKMLQKLIYRIPLNRKFIPGKIPYRGSSWMCINRPSGSYILDVLKTNEGQKYINFFKYSNCADEMLFHTILLNSSFAEYSYKFEEFINNQDLPIKNEIKAYLHYIDWDPTRENPAQFDLSDFNKLKESKALFARKFNEEKSKQLLLEIDRTIRKEDDKKSS